MKLTFILVVVFSAVISSLVALDQDYFDKYNGYVVYRVLPENVNHLELIKIIPAKLGNNVDFWSEPKGVNQSFDVMVHPSAQKIVESIFNSAKIKYSVWINNVGSLVEQQLASNNKPDNLKDFDYAKYHPLDEVNNWMRNIELQFPKYVTVINVTRSYQKRDIFAIKISIPNASNKPAIWLDGGIHAREWISTATVIHMAYTLLSNYSRDSNITEILNTFDFYILPVFNVDGYVYSWSKDRMWRKTRSKTYLPACVGVDPNRNWDSHHCEEGASKDPCSDSYCGPSPFSEPETKGVSDFILKHSDTIVCYINFHSYSQLWMSPYGYTTDKPKDFDLQDGGSIAAVTALKKLYGTEYLHGSISTTIYPASGSSADWTYDKAKVVYSYGVELRDQGKYGFLLPPDQILPSGLETFEAIKALAFFIKKNSIA